YEFLINRGTVDGEGEHQIIRRFTNSLCTPLHFSAFLCKIPRWFFCIDEDDITIMINMENYT
ncbi:MAG: hypothetical protein KAH86_03045, partial [Methanosarcinales archaeon]|nr:hypothetical protein [Methanosarcinales archaeon]